MHWWRRRCAAEEEEADEEEADEITVVGPRIEDGINAIVVGREVDLSLAASAPRILDYGATGDLRQ